MSIRDEEIKRLEQYAKGLGLRVEYRKPRKGYYVAAEVVSVEGISTRLIIYTNDRMSKTSVVLNFLHELGHHLSWIYKNRKDDPKLLAALIEEDNRKPGDPPISKEKRKLIYEMEKEDSTYRDYVAHEVHIKIPKQKLELDKQLDIWIYHYYYKHGNYPTYQQVSNKKKKLLKKLREG